MQTRLRSAQASFELTLSPLDAPPAGPDGLISGIAPLVNASGEPVFRSQGELDREYVALWAPPNAPASSGGLAVGPYIARVSRGAASASILLYLLSTNEQETALFFDAPPAVAAPAPGTAGGAAGGVGNGSEAVPLFEAGANVEARAPPPDAHPPAPVTAEAAWFGSGRAFYAASWLGVQDIPCAQARPRPRPPPPRPPPLPPGPRRLRGAAQGLEELRMQAAATGARVPREVRRVFGGAADLGAGFYCNPPMVPVSNPAMPKACRAAASRRGPITRGAHRHRQAAWSEFEEEALRGALGALMGVPGQALALLAAIEHAHASPPVPPQADNGTGDANGTTSAAAAPGTPAVRHLGLGDEASGLLMTFAVEASRASSSLKLSFLHTRSLQLQPVSGRVGAAGALAALRAAATGGDSELRQLRAAGVGAVVIGGEAFELRGGEEGEPGEWPAPGEEGAEAPAPEAEGGEDSSSPRLSPGQKVPPRPALPAHAREASPACVAGWGQAGIGVGVAVGALLIAGGAVVAALVFRSRLRSVRPDPRPRCLELARAAGQAGAQGAHVDNCKPAHGTFVLSIDPATAATVYAPAERPEEPRAQQRLRGPGPAPTSAV
eukprot:tig00001477_g8897.t1